MGEKEEIRRRARPHAGEVVKVLRCHGILIYTSANIMAVMTGIRPPARPHAGEVVCMYGYSGVLVSISEDELFKWR
jgi:hypothetical protein